MSVRELLFDIGFKGDATVLLKTNSAVDELKKDTIKMGSAIDSTLKSNTKEWNKLKLGIAGMGKALKSDLGSAIKETGAETKRATSLLDKLGNTGKKAYEKIKLGAQKTIGATDKLSTRMDNLSKKFSNLSKKSSALGNTLTIGLTVPILTAGGASFLEASNLQENIGKTEQVFKQQREEVLDWSKQSLENFGMAQSTALDMASLYGDMGSSMGLESNEVAGMSMNLTGLAADLSSFKNVDLSQTQNALKGIFTGETEALKNLGIVMTETNLAEYALSKGIQKKISKMSQAEKVQLRYNYVLEATKNAQGDFDRTGGNAANQMRVFKEGVKELGANFGTILLPEITSMIKMANEFLVKIKNMDEGQKKAITKVTLFVAALGPLTKGFSVVSQGLGIFTKGVSLGAKGFSFLTKGMGALMKGIPKLGKGLGGITKILPTLGKGLASIKMLGFKGIIKGAASGLLALGGSILPVIAVIGGLVAAGYLLWKNWDTIKAKGAAFIDGLKTKFMSFLPTIKGLWENLKIIFVALLPVFEGVFSTVGVYLGGFINIVTDVIGAVAKILKGLTDFIIGVFTGDWGKAWEGMAGVFAGVWEGIKAIFTGVLNTIIGGINVVIKSVNKMKVPDWVPGIGGKGINIPLIPTFAKGVNNFAGGAAIVGEEGPELVHLPRGSSVIPNRKTESIFRESKQFSEVESKAEYAKIKQDFELYPEVKRDRKRVSEKGLFKSLKKFEFPNFEWLAKLTHQYLATQISGDKQNITYIFSPTIQTTCNSSDPEKVSELNKNKVRELFDEWVDETLLIL